MGVLSQEKYKALFAQYFRYDVQDQQKVFYREIQLFLRGLCESLISEYQSDVISRINLTAFDPECMFNRSKDRNVDALMDCCLVFTRAKLVPEDRGAVVLQQYNEVSGYFVHRWRIQSTSSPIIDDVINLWLSYPHWHRCNELLDMFRVIICSTTRSPYVADFVDVGATSLAQGQMLSAVNFVRSWASGGLSGGCRKLMTGFLRHAETTDMQVSRLFDAERSRPWDQLLKVGVSETLTRCLRELSSDADVVCGASIDEYRSAVCAQLESLGAGAVGATKGKQRRQEGRFCALSFSVSDDEPLVIQRSGKRKPRKQSDVDIVSRAGLKTQLRGVSLRMSPTDRHRGKRSKQQKKMRRSCGNQLKATEQGRAAAAQCVTTRRTCRVLSSDSSGSEAV